MRTDPYNPDTDGYHFPDGEEAVLGTNPFDRYAFPITVGLDIKPGSDSNPINESGQGNLPVAILGSETFDVTSVDVTTLAFGPDESAPSHDLTKPGVFEDHLEDVNGAGFTDVVTHYQTEQTGILHEDLEACIVGKTPERWPCVGCDAIRDVPGRKGLRR